MSLRWFAFDADAYTGDTAHLTCEEHGAYLLLMLAYYRSEKPLPASDSALSTIVRLSLKRWRECRATLLPFFVEENGVWRHERIDHEIAEGYRKRQAYADRAQAGGFAKAKKASSVLKAAIKPASGQLERFPLPKPLDSLSVVRLTVDKEESGDNQPPSEHKIVEDQSSKVWHELVDNGIVKPNGLGSAYQDLLDSGVLGPEPAPAELTPIDRNYQPPEAIKVTCLTDGDASTFHLELQKFIFYQQQQGALSTDWDASFQLWWTRFTAYKRDRPKPKPRVEVNNTSTEESPAINWDWHLKRWMANQSTWSRRTAGPEPGQPGCRVPAEEFEKHGIDPATGLKAKETSE